MKTYVDIPRVAWLASEDNPDPVTRAQYRELADLPFDTTLPPTSPGEEATQEVRPTVAESLALLDRARECSHRMKPSCSCTFSHCGLDGRDKSSSECLACIRDRLIAHPAPPLFEGVFQAELQSHPPRT